MEIYLNVDDPQGVERLLQGVRRFDENAGQLTVRIDQHTINTSIALVAQVDSPAIIDLGELLLEYLRRRKENWIAFCPTLAPTVTQSSEQNLMPLLLTAQN